MSPYLPFDEDSVRTNDYLDVSTLLIVFAIDTELLLGLSSCQVCIDLVSLTHKANRTLNIS